MSNGGTAHTPGDGRLTVLIASPLEPTLVRRIEAAAPKRVRVIFEPELLPEPRYACDHDGRPRDLDPAQLARWRALLVEADILFDFDWMAPEQMSVNAPKLRWVQATSSGIGERLRATGLVDSPLVFTTVAGVHVAALAEFVILGLLYFRRDVPCLQRMQAAREWRRHANRDLVGTRALVVGLGAVGARVAAVCAAFGIEVWGCRRTSVERPPGVVRLVAPDRFREALGEAHALILCCPLTEETTGLVGEAELRAMRRDAVLVNIARGLVVDEPALVAALREKRIAGAALDVFAHEPLAADSPLWSLPNALVSPHSASTVYGENARIVDLFVENLHRFVRGESLRNEFSRADGY